MRAQDASCNSMRSLRFPRSRDVFVAAVQLAAAVGAGLNWSLCASAQSAVIHVSVSSAGTAANDVSTYPAITADGRFVAFKSFANNLTPGSSSSDIFVRDVVNGTTVWACPMPDGSTPFFGANAASISDDGRFVAFNSFSPMVLGDTGATDVFVRDLQSATTIRASVTYTGGQANDSSYPGKISANGQVVAFLSLATNLIPNDLNGGHFTFGRDIFVRDFATGTTELVNVSSAGVQGNMSADDFDLSFDGRYVVFRGGADNLVANDTNDRNDIFLRDRLLGQTIRLSVDNNGKEANDNCYHPSISADGRFVAFGSSADNLVQDDTNGWEDVFVFDCQTSVLERVSLNDAGIQGNDGSGSPSISDDGRRVCFRTKSTNLVLGDSDIRVNVFVRDRWAGTTRKVDRSPAGAHADNFSSSAEISGDGSSITYSSLASNILPSAANAWTDVFVVRHEELSPASYCTSTTNSQGCTPSMSWTGAPSASAGSGFVLSASQLLPSRPALFVYGVAGPAALPLGGGTQCVKAPLFRTPMQMSANAGVCGGAISLDFNAFIATGSHPLLVPGRSVWSQCWSRDPQASSTQSLSDGVFFVVEP